MHVQTRRNDGEIKTFDTLKEAMEDAKDLEVWKVSFALPTGERVRLIRDIHGLSHRFVFDPLLPDGAVAESVNSG